MTTIITKNSSTAGAVPTSSDLVQGELAVNVTDKALYTENASGTVVKLNAPSIVDNGNATAITIDSSENVGIGTSSPAQKLNVSGSGSIYGLITNTGTGPSNLFLGAANAQTQIISRNDTTGAVPTVFLQGTTESMRIDSSGNVGIGTSSPGSVSGYRSLNIKSTSGGELQLGNTAGTAQATLWSDANGLTYNNHGSTSHIWNTGGAEKMRIDSSGNLLVGTTTAGTSNTTGFNVTYASGSTYCSVGHVSGTGAGQPWMAFAYNGSAIGSITQSGTTATSYNTSSDYRLKENIQPMTGALSVVQQLKPCTYNWKADGSDGQGFIAHELQAVVPDCVTGEKDAVDEDGNPVYQGIDTSFLVATLTAAIQEQQAIITSLTARIEALEKA